MSVVLAIQRLLRIWLAVNAVWYSLDMIGAMGTLDNSVMGSGRWSGVMAIRPCHASSNSTHPSLGNTSDLIAMVDDPIGVIVDIRDVCERQRTGFIPGGFHAPRGMIAF